MTYMPPLMLPDRLARPGLAAVFPMYVLLIFAMIFLQKIGYTSGGASIGLDTPLIWLALGYLMYRRNIEVTGVRLLLLTLLIFSMLLSLVMGSNQYPKVQAMAIILALYGPLVFRITVPADLARRCLRVFQSCMVLIAGIVFAQQVIQYTIGNQYWPNLNAMLPHEFLYEGFFYLRSYAWNSPYYEPNGVFFLEPSGLSMYFAFAVAIEIACFRRVWRLAVYGAAMLATLAATGPTTLLLTAPFWMAKMGRRLALALLLGGVPLIALVLASGWLSTLTSRTDEMSHRDSSAYERVVKPLTVIGDQLADPELFTGTGPGTSGGHINSVQWPFSKLFYEYGLLTAVTFYLFLLTCVFDHPPSYIVPLIILVPETFFGGGFVAHCNTMPLLLFCSLLRAEPNTPAPAATSRGIVYYA